MTGLPLRASLLFVAALAAMGCSSGGNEPAPNGSDGGSGSGVSGASSGGSSVSSGGTSVSGAAGGLAAVSGGSSGSAATGGDGGAAGGNAGPHFDNFRVAAAWAGGFIGLSKSSSEGGVFVWDGNRVERIWVGDGSAPSVRNGTVAWQFLAPGSTTYEIAVWDNVRGFRQLTSNQIQDKFPVVLQDGSVAWAAPGGVDGGTDREIFLAHPDGHVEQLTLDSEDQTYPVTDGVALVWNVRGTIYFRQGDTVTEIPDGVSPAVFGDQVVYLDATAGLTTNRMEVLIFSGGITAQISPKDDTQAKNAPSIFEGRVGWTTRTVLKNEITHHYFDAGAITKFTYSDVPGSDQQVDSYAKYSTAQVTSRGMAWAIARSGGNEVHFWDGTTDHLVRQGPITTDSLRAVGRTLLWKEQPPGADSEIYVWNAGSSASQEPKQLTDDTFDQYDIAPDPANPGE